MSEANKGWLLKLPMKGATATVRVDGDVTYEVLAKLAQHILDVGDYLRPDQYTYNVVVLPAEWPMDQPLPKSVVDEPSSEPTVFAGTGQQSPPVEAGPTVWASKVYAECPTCQKQVHLNVDGTLRVHGPHANRCPAMVVNPIIEAAKLDPNILKALAPDVEPSVVAVMALGEHVDGHNPDWIDESEEPQDPPVLGATSLDQQARELFVIPA